MFTGGAQVSSNGGINRTRICTLPSSDSDVPSHTAVCTPFHRYITVPGHPGQEGGQEETGEEGVRKGRGVNDVREGGKTRKDGMEGSEGEGVKKHMKVRVRTMEEGEMKVGGAHSLQNGVRISFEEGAVHDGGVDGRGAEV